MKSIVTIASVFVLLVANVSELRAESKNDSKTRTSVERTPSNVSEAKNESDDGAEAVNKTDSKSHVCCGPNEGPQLPKE